jgi:predicted nucleic acid-binding protein
VFFDACSLINFAAVDRLDLLENRYGHRAGWTASVREEIRRGLRVAPYLRNVLDAAWLGEPIDIEGDSADLAQIDLLRRALGGGRASQLEHLGEAETIFYLEHHASNGIFVTDDRPAFDFAKNRNLFVLDSPGLLAECYSYDEIGCPAAYQLLEKMANEGRGSWYRPITPTCVDDE